MSSQRFKKIGLLILAAIAGEFILVLGTTLAQEVLYNGLSYRTSSLTDIVLGGLATFLAAVLAGLTASMVIRGSTGIPHLLISLFIIAEMSWLIASGSLFDPLWFDVLSGLSLIVGVWAGYYAFHVFLPNPSRV